MAGRSTKPKQKKPIETTLGQAPKVVPEEQSDIDLSQIRKPINTSILGVPQLLSAFHAATQEVKDYLKYECDLLFECRTCRSLFRSLANIILHKRNYCKEKYQNINYKSEETIITNVDYRCMRSTSTKSISPIIEKLLEKRDSSVNANDANNDVIFISDGDNIVLESIDTSDKAKFQTFVKKTDAAEHPKDSLMKNEVLEIHEISEGKAVLMTSDGKISPTSENIPTSDSTLKCSECSSTFSNPKTLSHHVQSKHSINPIIFPCPNCEETFGSTWSVYRHLYNVHKLTTAQVKKLRCQIYNSGIPKDQQQLKKSKESTSRAKTVLSEEAEWMAHFEHDGLLQMCGGCGKKFERKAALISHSQMCLKRMNACNANKENSKARQKKVVEQETKQSKVEVRKGSAKRKPQQPPVHLIDICNEDDENSCEKSEDTQPNALDSNANKKVELPLDGEEKTDASNNEESPEKQIRLRNNKVVVIPKNSDVAERKKKFREVQRTKKTDKNRDEIIDRVEDGVPPKMGDVRIVPAAKTAEEDKEEADNTLQAELLADLEKVIGFLPEPSTSSKDERPSETDQLLNYDPDDDASKSSELVEEVIISDDEDEDAQFNLQLDDSPPKLMPHELSELLTDETDMRFFNRASKYMDLNAMKCLHCEEHFKSRYMLLLHMSLHFSWFRFQCSKCSFVTYTRYDCMAHATEKHRLSGEFIQNTILPIPEWKVLAMTHGFRKIPRAGKRSMSYYPAGHRQRKMPRLEPMLELKPVSVESVEIDLTATQEGANSEQNQCDDESKQQFQEDDNSTGVAEDKTETALRPVRNRMRSVKTLNDDFIYDLGKVLKFNDNAIRSGNKSKNNKSA